MHDLAVDNDLLIKTIRYRLSTELFSHCQDDDRRQAVGVLGTARWVCEARLRRSIQQGQASPDVMIEFEALLSASTTLEPTRDELELAAELEALASEHRLPLDTGESQLAAIVALRTGLLVTGDKRAVESLEKLSAFWPSQADTLLRRVAGLEHAIMTLLVHLGIARVRAAICAAPDADIAMRLAFAPSPEGDNSPPLGLLSYLRALERSAPTLCTESQSLCWDYIAS